MGKDVDKSIAITFVKQHHELPVKLVCTTLNISKSTYYRWLNHQESKQYEGLSQKIIDLCKQHKYRLGYRKITALLNRKQSINHKVVQKIMQLHGLQCRVKPKKHKRVGQVSTIAEHHLNRDFRATRPLQKLVTDITYLPFGQHMLYLSSIKDLYNGEIIAYTIRSKQDTDCVLDTLNQLPALTSDCLLHSDQGSVYTSYVYQNAVKQKGITMSMSRKGTPADNAPIESFHATLKCETFYLDRLTCTTTAIVEQTVRDYIYYYNHFRIQAKLKYQSPIEYRELAS